MLPDEIISEILSPALKVSEQLFSETSDVSPFSNYKPSTSDYLLVCKDWLRVATPLLYNVVVIRSKAQANALQQVLKANPEFGRFIKKLRVEGGYGAAMHTILKFAPYITDLFITLSIYSSDGTGGLCKGLPLINPHRIIIVDPHVLQPLANKQLERLQKTLFDCIRSWSNLRIFGYPHSAGYSHTPLWAEQATELSQVLAQTQVHTVTFNSAFDDIPQGIATLYAIPSLKVIQFQRPLDEKLVSQIESDPRLKKLAKYTHTHMPAPIHIESEIAPFLNPFFVPMQSASEETRATVWKRVLFFAMYTEEMRSPAFSRRPSAVYPSRLPILCVSKDFHRLALPYLLESLHLSHNITGLAQLLKKTPHLGSSIRRIFTDSPSLIYQDSMCQIFRNTHCLEILAPAHKQQLQMRTKSFGELVKTAGHSIQELSVFLFDSTEVSPSLLKHFTSLRALDIGGGMRLTGHDLGAKAPLNVLTTVQDLCIREDLGGGLSINLVELFANSRLDSLRTLVLPRIHKRMPALENFIKVHGEKLHQLTLGPLHGFRVLRFCPNLTTINLLDRDDLEKLIPDTRHPALVKISTPSLPKKADSGEMEAMLDMYPSLREIEFRDLNWPTNERAIAKSKAVLLAESLLPKNIKVLDEHAKHWTPRLK
ncbi:hypothetical protein FB45DRAFT_1078437 [Roridomyces roridus]|uniref:Uncharacterized protein n=1 Tax=Roridomyces roridus TaxID=1738132 RepID=A0AAD7G339_9AGAR|nr:hypothetical protein FB45DRAFT_1078437 [Roridomyces roridus]